MWPLGFGMLSSAASAQEGPWNTLVAPKLGEEWSDGLTRRPIRTPGATLEGVAVVGGVVEPMFGAVTAGYGTDVGPKLSLGFGVDAHAVRIDGASSRGVLLQTLGLEGWAVLDQDNVRHGFGLSVYTPVQGSSGWYLYHPAEGGRRGLFTYDGYVELGAFDLSYDVKAGLSSTFGIQLTMTLAGVYELEEHVALSLALQGGFSPVAVALIGLDVRPVDHLEVSAGFGVPGSLFSAGDQAEFQPSVRVKAWF